MPFLPGSKHHNFKHGQSAASGCTGAYKSWCSMKTRCNPNSAEDYPDYAGRGISVCAEWQSSFIEFFESMGPRPDGCSIDRIDVNGNYEPGNCRWATAKEQRRNQRFKSKGRPSSVIVNFFGEEVRAIDISKKHEMPLTTLYRRISQGLRDESLISRRHKLKDRVGEKCHTSKLTGDQVLMIKKKLESGQRVGVIATEYGVSQPTISNIKSGATWSHVKTEKEE